MITIVSLIRFLDAYTIDMELNKCKFQNSYPSFFSNMLLVHIGIVSKRQLQCAPRTYILSINEFFTINFSQTYIIVSVK